MVVIAARVPVDWDCDAGGRSLGGRRVSAVGGGGEGAGVLVSDDLCPLVFVVLLVFRLFLLNDREVCIACQITWTNRKILRRIVRGTITGV